MPKARINRAANAAAEPSHSLKGSRALQERASHCHRLPACHLTQPDVASTRPSMNTVGSRQSIGVVRVRGVRKALHPPAVHISHETFQANRSKLKANRYNFDAKGRGAAREGAGLLQ